MMDQNGLGNKSRGIMVERCHQGRGCMADSMRGLLDAFSCVDVADLYEADEHGKTTAIGFAGLVPADRWTALRGSIEGLFGGDLVASVTSYTAGPGGGAEQHRAFVPGREYLNVVEALIRVNIEPTLAGDQGGGSKADVATDTDTDVDPDMKARLEREGQMRLGAYHYQLEIRGGVSGETVADLPCRCCGATGSVCVPSMFTWSAPGSPAMPELVYQLPIEDGWGLCSACGEDPDGDGPLCTRPGCLELHAGEHVKRAADVLREVFNVQHDDDGNPLAMSWNYNGSTGAVLMFERGWSLPEDLAELAAGNVTEMREVDRGGYRARLYPDHEAALADLPAWPVWSQHWDPCTEPGRAELLARGALEREGFLTTALARVA